MQSNPMLAYVPDDDWYLYDHLGTPLALSDEQGQVVAEWVRDPFGNVVSKTGAVDDNHMFPGQFLDAASGLVYNWNRWYAPEIGRYVEVDPLDIKRLVRDNTKRSFSTTLVNGRPQQLTYGYAESNPLRYFDPLGTTFLEIPYPNWYLNVACVCPDNTDIIEPHVFTENVGAGVYRGYQQPWTGKPYAAVAICYCKGKIIDTVNCDIDEYGQEL